MMRMCARGVLATAAGVAPPHTGEHTWWGLPRSPWPHHGAIPVQTHDMEGSLRLVWEGHRDGVAVHGLRAPHAGSDRVLLPPPRTFALCHAVALSARHDSPTSHAPATGRALGGSSGRRGTAQGPVTLGRRASPSWSTGECSMKARDVTAHHTCACSIHCPTTTSLPEGYPERSEIMVKIT